MQEHFRKLIDEYTVEFELDRYAKGLDAEAAAMRGETAETALEAALSELSDNLTRIQTASALIEGLQEESVDAEELQRRLSVVHDQLDGTADGTMFAILSLVDTMKGLVARMAH